MDSNPRAILVVEDEPNLRTVAAATLSSMGLTTFEAANAQQALDIVSINPDICLIFSDIRMPGEMDGLMLARHLHDKNPHIEILITSGVEEVSNEDLPAFGTFIPKPYLPSQLKAIVQAKLMASSF